MENKNPLYYEAHVTIEPVFDERLENFRKICELYEFRVADLLFKKRKHDTPQRSSFDAFCTGRSKEYEDLQSRTCSLVNELKNNNFEVWRYKIESTLLDSKFGSKL